MTDTKKNFGVEEKKPGTVLQTTPVRSAWLQSLLRPLPKIPQGPKQKKSCKGQLYLFPEDNESEHD